MDNRWKSPIVWGTVLAALLIEWDVLSEVAELTFWNIGRAVIALGIVFFGALNNPTNRDGF